MVVFRIPLADSNIEKLKFRSKIFANRFHYKKESALKEYLEEIGVKLSREEYLGIVLRSFVNVFLILLILFNSVLMLTGVPMFWIYGVSASFLFTAFVSFSQLAYVRVFVSKREKDIEKNLIFALEDILIQLNSGIPLFDILTNVSLSEYGELSI